MFNISNFFMFETCSTSEVPPNNVYGLKWWSATEQKYGLEWSSFFMFNTLASYMFKICGLLCFQNLKPRAFTILKNTRGQLQHIITCSSWCLCISKQSLLALKSNHKKITTWKLWWATYNIETALMLELNTLWITCSQIVWSLKQWAPCSRLRPTCLLP